MDASNEQQPRPTGPPLPDGFDGISFDDIAVGNAEEAFAARLRQEEGDVQPTVARARFCIAMALTGMQYERWGNDERLKEIARRAGDDKIGERLFELVAPTEQQRYARVTRESYHRALEILLHRFGEEAFGQEVERVMRQHLDGLHTARHMYELPYAPHSDSHPLGDSLLVFARQVIDAAHPVPETMAGSGYIVNLKTLFGDAEFWQLMRVRYPAQFHRFVDFLMGLPRNYKQHLPYGTAIIDPVALVRQYFPDAHKEIVASRPDFVSDTREAIRILPRE